MGDEDDDGENGDDDNDLYYRLVIVIVSIVYKLFKTCFNLCLLFIIFPIICSVRIGPRMAYFV